MSESVPVAESFENLPSEELVFSTIADICGTNNFAETNRKEVGGKIRSLEIRLTEPTAEGMLVQLEYFVNKLGAATVDVAYFDQTIGFDYATGKGYEPQNISRGKVLGRFVDGTWLQISTLSMAE